MKKILGLLMVLTLTGCALNPPQAPSAKGNWVDVITTPNDLRNI